MKNTNRVLGNPKKSAAAGIRPRSIRCNKKSLPVDNCLWDQVEPAPDLSADCDEHVEKDPVVSFFMGASPELLPAILDRIVY